MHVFFFFFFFFFFFLQILDDNTVLNTVLAGMLAFWVLNSLLQRSRAAAFHKRIHNLSAELQVINNQLHHEVAYSNMVKRAVTEVGIGSGSGLPRSKKNWMVMARKGLLERHVSELEEIEFAVRRHFPTPHADGIDPAPLLAPNLLDEDVAALFKEGWLGFLRVSLRWCQRPERAARAGGGVFVDTHTDVGSPAVLFW